MAYSRTMNDARFLNLIRMRASYFWYQTVGVIETQTFELIEMVSK